MNGVLIINKSEGVTSRDIVNDLVHIFHTKKIGHTGTLDPIASGVLVVTIGKYTKLNEVIMSNYKEYIATMELGYLTDTLDNTGIVLKTNNNQVDNIKILEVINSFKKKYYQEVPLYSSVKINGKKLYEYARKNESVELPKRNVDIKEIEILKIDGKIIKFKCLVSKGTYIRSLIRDIGNELNTYATMTSLIRTKQGKFNIEESYTVEEVRNGNYKLLNLEDVLDLEIIECDEILYKKVYNGMKLINIYNKEFVLFKYNNRDICVYRKSEECYKMYLLLI